jgi:hypothetical protein
VAVGLTIIDAEVCEPLQRYVPPLVPRVTLLPTQMIPSLFAVPNDSVAAMTGVGRSFTVTALVAVAEHLLASVTVTV